MTRLIFLVALFCYVARGEDVDVRLDQEDVVHSSQTVQQSSLENSGENTGGEVEEKIIGGKQVLPWMFLYVPKLYAITRGNLYKLCSGTVLNDRVILTSADCVTYSNGQKDDVIAAVIAGGVTNFSQAEIFVHPGYDSIGRRNDIAVLKLSINRQPLANFGTPPTLSTAEVERSLFNGKEGIAVGWGKISDAAKSMGSSLQQAGVNVYYPCDETQTLICTYNIGGLGVCSGDGGGPLLVQYLGRPYVVGVASFMTSQRCEATSPKAYTHVYSHLNWLKTVI